MEGSQGSATCTDTEPLSETPKSNLTTMHLLRRPLTALCLALLLIGVAACGDGGGISDAPEQTVAEIIESTSGLATFDTALDTTNVINDLTGDGPYTVFAPGLSAFSDLGTGAVDSLLARPDLLTKLLRQHVVQGDYNLADLTDGLELEALDGSTLTVEVDGDNRTFVDGARIHAAQEATNGYVHHLFGDVIEENLTLVERAQIRPALLGTLLSGAVATEIDLTGDGPFTVFAPSNSGFNTLNAIEDDDLLKRILQRHVVAGQALTASQLMDGMTLDPVGGEALNVTVEDGDVLIDGVPVDQPNLQATNAVVHVLDSVLLDGITLVERASLTPLLDTLVMDLTTAGLVDDLEGMGPYTVFAPTNAAFGTINEIGSTELLTRILGQHVVAGQELTADRLTDGMTLTTLEGAQLTVSVDEDGNVFVDGAPVVTADVEVTNGVIHYLGSPIIENVALVERVALMPAFDELVKGLTEAELLDALSGAGPYTVFAPDNSAFAGLGEGAVDTLAENNPELLSKLLRQHVVVGQELTASQLGNMDGQTLTTLEGAQLTVDVDEDGNVSVDGVPVATADVEVTNGVVHGLGGVILENTNVVERASLTPSLSRLAAAVRTAGLADDLQAAGPFTVFAPNDAAFGAIPDSVFEALSEGELADLLRYHVAPGELRSSDLTDGRSVPTLLNGASLTVLASEADGVQLIDAQRDTVGVTLPDVTVSNGVVHVLNGVLMPASDDSDAGNGSED